MVVCDGCSSALFGVHHVCIECQDYHLCHSCAMMGVSTKQHSSDHAMQCVIVLAEMQELPPDDERTKFVNSLEHQAVSSPIHVLSHSSLPHPTSAINQ
eukprot:c3215_g1_i3.p1 GENE.c3215_g1_i3~~c3215_g1_i3.p1  ORF type:complete len:109 (-),score=15.39 c3215_g1_i3:335-628(-)